SRVRKFRDRPASHRAARRHRHQAQAVLRIVAHVDPVHDPLFARTPRRRPHGADTVRGLVVKDLAQNDDFRPVDVRDIS
ncbi:MAG: hypothetical protein QGG89_17435, partial [Vicinamibacterales bacterium]|nr:hypothetical protein [Vicinamibacterales bacterium]